MAVDCRRKSVQSVVFLHDDDDVDVDDEHFLKREFQEAGGFV